MPKWSEAQSLAINHLDKNLIVSASAGSGKTAVLTARMVKRITQDKVGVENLLAMTFTDAAASEMKSRLFQGLTEVMNQTEDDDLRQLCATQCALLSTALICTIHSFCLDVIKENYFVIQLNPKRILKNFTEDELVQIKSILIKQVLSEMHQTDRDLFIKVCDQFSGRIEDVAELEKSILNLANLASQQIDQDQFFKHVLNLSLKVKRVEDFDESLLDYYFIKMNFDIKVLEDLIQQCLNICISNQLDDLKPLVQLKLDKLQLIKSAINNKNIHDSIHYLRSTAEAVLKNGKDEEYKAVRSEINKLCQSYVASYFDDHDLVHYSNDYEIVEFLVRASKRFLILFEEEKEKQEGIDFNDMEHLAYKILSANNHAVAKKYQNRFDEILVDEFQDTNYFQNTMIEMISRGNNVFRVGDVKQSIYGFRGAKPQIMANLMSKKDEFNSSLTLHHNYRSMKSIVDFNNALFDKLMNIPELDNSFSHEDHALIGVDSQDDKYNNLTEFLLIPSDTDEDEEFSVVKKYSSKAVVIAQKIIEMKNSSSFDKWSDYCVLVRSHAIKDQLRFVFDEMNIPYSTVLQSGFYKSPSVLTITSYLNIVLDRKNDISCVSVLKELYDYTSDQLARIQLERNYSSYFEFSSILDQKFKDEYLEINDILINDGICASICKIIQINDYYSLKLNKQERANVDMFIQKAQEYEKNNSSLLGFLAQIDACYDLPSSMAVGASKSENVVQITTIHQSKGLQYPVVFYMSSWRNSKGDTQDGAIIDEELGVGLYNITMPYRYRRSTLQRIAIETKKQLEAYAENVRIYYVALTRAQKKCILVDKITDSYNFQDLSMLTFLKKKGSSDLILSAFNNSNFPFYRQVYYPEQPIEKSIKFINNKIVLPIYAQTTKKTIEMETPSSYESSVIEPFNQNTNLATQRGSSLHKLIEALPGLPWSSEIIKSISPDVSNNDIERLLKLGNNEQFVDLYKNKVIKEYSFATFQNHKIIHGFIDLISIGSDDITIIDFKTDTDVDELELIKRYTDQLNGYRNSIQIQYPNHQVNTKIYSFFLSKFVEI